MALMWKCVAVGLTAALLGILLRKDSGEQAALLGLAAAAVITVEALGSLRDAEEFFRNASERSGLRPTLTIPVAKSLGLALTGKLGADLCRDAGQSATASAIELASACLILCVAVPLLRELAEVVFAFT